MPLGGNLPGTVILMLAFAWTFTASPVSGQVRQEILHRAERANESIQTRVGSMYDLGRDVPQNDPEDGSWKRILIGAGVGLTVGFVVGWTQDHPDDGLFGWAGSDMCRVVSVHNPGVCLTRDTTPWYTIIWSLAGIGAGAAIGWLWPFGEDDPG